MLQAGWQPVPGHRLTRPLGAGAFAEVWEAVRDDGARLAFKFLDCRAHSPSLVASEVRMLRSLTALNHPHIVPLYTAHATGRYLVLSLELADGNLADLQAAYVRQTGENVPAEHALDLLGEAACALDFMAATRHPALPSAQGLQHCDVKPSNLLVFGDKLKVADFGLCAGSGWHTHKGGWKGTLPYAAPELYNGAAAPGTDQYALAVTFCELVLGREVFYQGGSPTGLPVNLGRLRDRELPVIARALHPYPSARWPSCAAFVAALRAAVLGAQLRRAPRVSLASVAAPPRPRRRTRSSLHRAIRGEPRPARGRP